MTPQMKRAWKEVLVTVAIVVITVLILMAFLLTPVKARAQELVGDMSPVAAPPYAMHAATLRPTELSRREEIRVDVAETKSLLGDAFIDRYLVPYEDRKS